MPEINSWRSVAAQIERTYTRRGRQQSGLFSLEGIRLHERALRAGQPPETVLLSSSLHADPAMRVQQLLTALAQAGSRLVVAPEEVVASLTEGRQLGQILGLRPFPTPPSLANLLQNALSPLLLVAADVVDPGNVGALLRTAHASGAAALVAAGRSDPTHPRAVRTSRGSLFKLPVLIYADLPPLLADLQAQDVVTVGTAVVDGMPLSEARFVREKTAVFMGNEYWGLDNDTRAALHRRITIPMQDGVDSYAVNAAAAILLYEIRRQWQ